MLYHVHGVWGLGSAGHSRAGSPHPRPGSGGRSGQAHLLPVWPGRLGQQELEALLVASQRGCPGAGLPGQVPSMWTAGGRAVTREAAEGWSVLHRLCGVLPWGPPMGLSAAFQFVWSSCDRKPTVTPLR